MVCREGKIIGFKIGADMIVPELDMKNDPDEARRMAEKNIAYKIANELIERNLIHISVDEDTLAWCGDVLFRGYVVVRE